MISHIYPEGQKAHNIRETARKGIKNFVSNGHHKCKRCGEAIAEGETFAWVYGKGNYHIGSCPKP